MLTISHQLNYEFKHRARRILTLLSTDGAEISSAPFYLALPGWIIGVNLTSFTLKVGAKSYVSSCDERCLYAPGLVPHCDRDPSEGIRGLGAALLVEKR